MTAPDRAAAMVAAARQRHDDTRRRATEALRRLDAAGRPVTFTAVAREAAVSRAWLYRDPALRTQIDRLRLLSPAPARPLPAAQRATPDSLRNLLDTTRAELDAARDENRRLHEALARKLGEHRQTGPIP